MKIKKITIRDILDEKEHIDARRDIKEGKDFLSACYNLESNVKVGNE